MAKFIPEKMTLITIASGHLSLELTETVRWENFPLFAEQLVALLGGLVVNKADGVEICVWKIRVQDCELRLVYEDYPTMVSLESSSDAGDKYLRDVQHSLSLKYENLK